jgi:hypothetical protein
MKLPTAQCKTCPFLPDGLLLGADRMANIYQHLFEGTNHLCHSRSNQTICFGGRQWQLYVWHQIGRISAPTNEALAEAMRAAGVEPKEHICE